MSDRVTTGGLDADDQRTHVERINPPFETVTEVMQVVERGALRLYRMLAKGQHNGRIYRPGETVMLHPDEIGPHHQLVEEPDAPDAQPDPVIQNETVHYADGSSATGPAPLPLVSPDGAVAIPAEQKPPE